MTERLHFHFSLSCIGEENGNPLQCSCLENPRDGGAWWAAVYGVAQSWTRLKRLSSSSSIKKLVFICVSLMTNVVERLFLVLLCLLCIFGDTSVKIFFPPFKKSVCFSSPLCILNASLLIGVRIYKCFLTVCGFFFFFF